MIRRVLLCLAAMALAALLLAEPAQAASFTLRTGNNAGSAQTMTIDSNQCATAGPRAMYVGGLVTAGGAAETSVTASISTPTNGFFLAGGQQQTQTIGSLAAGGTAGAFWFIGYGCTVNASTTVTITITSSAGTTTRNITLTAKTAISANAGGNVTSSTLGPGAVVGQTIYFDTAYDFGGSDIGDEFMFQPSGGQNFNAGCFRMVGSRVMASNITPVVVGTTNQLYFLQTQKQSGNGYTATIRYYFEYQCANTTTTARPYAMQTSGNALKYTGNFDGSGAISMSFPGATNPFTITKTEDRSFTLAGTSATVKYTVTISNPSAYDSRISQIVDTLPTGASFAAIDASSQVTGANSSSVPSAGATGTITFSGKQDVSYVIAAGGSVTLIYTVTMPSTAGSYTNNVQAYFGQATSATASATFTVYTPAPITVVKSSQAYSDPVNGTTNPKLIPGSYVHYTITVTNPAAYSIDANSIIITDATPSNLTFFVNNLPSAGAPVLFQDGSTSSALTFTYTSLSSTSDDVDFSNNGGSSWSYTPVPNASGFDAAVTNIRIRPKGTMAANSSFALIIRYQVN
jgi:fimbrial isopeptide formation D2 family protein